MVARKTSKDISANSTAELFPPADRKLVAASDCPSPVTTECQVGKKVGSDISDSTLTVNELEAARQHLRDIVNTTDGIVWEADAQTFSFTFVSQKAERLLGYPVEDWYQPGFWLNNLHPDDKTWAPEFCASCTGRLEPHDFEYRFIARDGRVVWLHDIVTVVAEQGKPRWLRGIMVDITRRRLAEEKVAELAATLEAKVKERTMQVRRLSGQLTMAEERERRVLAEELHDNLGQLLAVIKIKLTSLPTSAHSDEIAQIIDLVAQADRAARGITNQLSPPILSRLGLKAALECLGDEMQRVYGLAVHTGFNQCRNCEVVDLRNVLYRAARELLVNVAKHAEASEASLTCTCKGDRLTIAVSDVGCGFDPVEHTGEWLGHGSFGLRSICERVTNLGGEMEVASTPGNGTTITVSLPRHIERRRMGDLQ